MQSVTGDLEAGEAQGAMSAIGARQRGSIAFFYGVMLAMAVVGGAAGYALGWALDHLVTHQPTVDPVLALIVGLWIGLIVYRVYCRPLVVRRFRKRMADRGLDTLVRLTLTINDDTFEMDSGLVRSVARWSAVTEVLKTRKHWIFLVQMSPWFAPRRFFADEAEERAFIRAVLARLSDAARARSKDAVAFAGL